MSKFLAGFTTACVLWAGVLAGLHFGFGWGPPTEAELILAEVPDPVPQEEPVQGSSARRGRGGRKRGAGGGAGANGRAPAGEATTGDDLGDVRMRTIDGDGTGGEQQLSGAQIDAAFDAAMGRIRRCFLLVAGEDPITGRLVFGLRIAGSGLVQAVNLSGPAPLTTGEAGACLREAARGIRFPTFDGPEMIVRYPITLE